VQVHDVAAAPLAGKKVIDTCNFFLSEGRRLYGQTVP